MEALGGRGGIAPTHSRPRHKMGWVVSITPRPRFTPGERTPGTHCTGGWVGPRAGLDTENIETVGCLKLGLEHFIPYPVHYLLIIQSLDEVSSLLLRSWLYSPLWAFRSLMDLIQSSLCLDLCSQFLIIHFLTSPYTQFHHLDLGQHLGRLPWGWLAKTWYLTMSDVSSDIDNASRSPDAAYTTTWHINKNSISSTHITTNST
jgi:hypothetical protein